MSKSANEYALERDVEVLRAELAAARAAIEDHKSGSAQLAKWMEESRVEAMDAKRKAASDRALARMASTDLDACRVELSAARERLATAEDEYHADIEQCLARCRTLLGKRDVHGVMDGVEQLARRMQRAEADSRRLDWLEAWEPGDPNKVWTLICDWNVDGKGYPEGLRAAIDAAGGQG